MELLTGSAVGGRVDLEEVVEEQLSTLSSQGSESLASRLECGLVGWLEMLLHSGPFGEL